MGRQSLSFTRTYVCYHRINRRNLARKRRLLGRQEINPRVVAEFVLAARVALELFSPRRDDGMPPPRVRIVERASGKS